jgi:hypothetical protein
VLEQAFGRSAGFLQPLNCHALVCSQGFTLSSWI